MQADLEEETAFLRSEVIAQHVPQPVDDLVIVMVTAIVLGVSSATRCPQKQLHAQHS